MPKITNNPLVSETLKLWENGAITLPKEWRRRYPTKHFLAEEDERGNLIIKPIVDSQYYEMPDGSFGLTFPTGIEAGKLAGLLS